MYGDEFEDVLSKLWEDLLDYGYFPHDWEIIPFFDGGNMTVGTVMLAHRGDAREPVEEPYTHHDKKTIKNIVKRYSQVTLEYLVEDNLGNLDLTVSYNGYWD